MDLPKRKEDRPPVPKFTLIRAATDSPDFLPPQKAKKSSITALSLDIKTETSVENNNESYLIRKRISAIVKEIITQINLLGLSEDLLKIGIKFLKPELLDGLKQKRYKAIAVAIIIASLKQINALITQKEILSKTSVSEKQIKQILLQIHNSYNQQDIVNSFIKQISSEIGLNDRFINFCLQMFNEINQSGLIQGEHENLIAGAIIKYCGDIIFADRGGIVIQVIADKAQCSLGPLKNFLKKIQLNSPFTTQAQKEK